MKKIFKLLCLVLALTMSLGIFAGCHEKGEIAYTIGDHEYTSAMYSCALMDAATSARNLISTFITENNGDTKNVDYNKYKFDKDGNVSATGTISYKDFVKDTAINTLKTFSIIKDKMAAEKLTLPDEYRESAQIQGYYYWYAGCDYNTYATYGEAVLSYYTPYMTIYENNGVLYNTYEEFMVLQATYNFYFEHLYGKDGAKEVSDDTIKEYMNTHYVIADTLELSKVDSSGKTLSDEKLKELKAKADAYAKRINSGEKFDKIYAEYEKEQATTNSSSSTSSTTSSKTSSTASTSSVASSSNTANSSSTSAITSGSVTIEDEFTPEEYTLIYGDEESGYDDKYFADLYKTAAGKAIVIDDEVSSSYKVLVRGDILKEDYYFDNMQLSILYDLKQEEFDKDMKADADKLTVTEDKHATKPFQVDDIKLS